MIICELCRIPRNDKTVKQGLTFHSLPMIPEVRKEWVQFIFEEVGVDVERRKKVHLCNKHFKKHWFTNRIQRPRLKRSAVPSIPSRKTRRERRKRSSVVAPWPSTSPRPTEDANSDKNHMELVDHLLPAKKEKCFPEAPSDANSSHHYTNGHRNIVEPMDDPEHVDMVYIMPDAIPNENMVDTTYAKDGMMINDDIDDSLSVEEKVFFSKNYISREKLTNEPSGNQDIKHKITNIWPDGNFVSSSTAAIGGTMCNASSKVSYKSDSSISNNEAEIVPIYISSDEENETNNKCARLKREMLKLLNVKERREKRLELFKVSLLQAERSYANLHSKYIFGMSRISIEEANGILPKCGKNQEFIRRYIAKRSRKVLPKSYDSTIEEFALELYRISPGAYSFFRKKFLNILPPIRHVKKKMKHSH